MKLKLSDDTKRDAESVFITACSFAQLVVHLIKVLSCSRFQNGWLILYIGVFRLSATSSFSMPNVTLIEVYVTGRFHTRDG